MTPTMERSSSQDAAEPERIAPVILYVDDDENDAFLLRSAARSVNFEGTMNFAIDGEGAVSFLRSCGSEELPHLILLDVKMPRMDGLEVLQWIRSQQAMSHIPVAMFTSSEHSEDIRRAYFYGADIFMLKASTFERLVEFLQSLDRVFARDIVDLDVLRQDPSFRPPPR